MEYDQVCLHNVTCELYRLSECPDEELIGMTKKLLDEEIHELIYAVYIAMEVAEILEDVDLHSTSIFFELTLGSEIAISQTQPFNADFL